MQDTLEGPASQLRPGVTDHSNISAVCFTMAGVCLAIALVSAAMRMYTKLRILKSAYFEDWLFTVGCVIYAS